MAKCISYFVDAESLKNGIPIDKLERHNVREIHPFPIDPPNFNKRLLGRRETKPISKPNLPKELPQLPQLWISDADYKRIIKGQGVKVAVGQHGKVYRVVNRSNHDRSVIRQIQAVGDVKFFRRVADEEGRGQEAEGRRDNAESISASCPSNGQIEQNIENANV